MISSYIKRSENRNQLRYSQSRLGTSASVQSRNTSRKKYIEVYSKRSNQLQKSGAQQNLKESVMSLPIKFQQRQNNFPRSNIQISKSQINLNNPPYHNVYMSPPVNNVCQFLPRGYSLPSKTIIIREVIKPIPVNFSYMHPQNVRIQPTPSYRMSLPVNTPNKCQIIKSQQSKMAAAPIRLFSNAPFNTFQIAKKQSTIQSNIGIIQIQNSHKNTPQKRPTQRNQLTFQRQSNILYQKPPQIMRTSQLKITNENICKSQVSSKKLLNNQSYIDCEIKLRDIAVNTEAPSLKCSIIYEKYQSRQASKPQSRIVKKDPRAQQKLQYNSLVVTKQDEDGCLKQNLELKQNECICERIKNITQNSIKINKKQSLKPKKNFVFV